jgi:adenosylcobinamide-GDP ribazoletransferase
VARLAPLRFAVSLLTVVPVGRKPIDLPPQDVGRAMSLAPLVGLFLWLPAGLLMFASRLLLNDSVNSSLLVPVVGLGTIALLTGGLHLDGLADLADGFGSRRSGAAALAIMKDSSIGAMGAMALVFVIIAQVGSLSLAVTHHHGTVALLTSQLAGRLAIVHACRSGIPAARTDGLGLRVIGSVTARRAALTTLAVFVVAGVAGKLDYDGGRLRESAHAMFAVLCAVVVAAILRRIAVWRLGGMTGDVFGALVEVAVVVDLAVMSAVAPSWLH